MRKISHSAHETVTELNITPLLDLAFVLLVIFIITTTPIVNDLELNLPTASKRLKDPKPKVNYVTLEQNGKLYLNKEEVDLPRLQEKLIELRVEDPDLNVVIRGDGRSRYGNVLGVLDAVQQANVTRINLATEVLPEPPASRTPAK